MDVAACVQALRQCVEHLRRHNAAVRIVFTVSPIRYRKYGYHGSQLSKSTLLLAIDQLVAEDASDRLYYFPSYEIVNDELRDYRFYQPDMLHPSEQTVDYLSERFREACFSEAAKQMVAEWRPIREALAHKPFHPDSSDYRKFLAEALRKKEAFERKFLGDKG